MTRTVCAEPVWDGPFRMICGHWIIDGRCVRHGSRGLTRNLSEETLPSDRFYRYRPPVRIIDPSTS